MFLRLRKCHDPSRLSLSAYQPRPSQCRDRGRINFPQCGRHAPRPDARLGFVATLQRIHAGVASDDQPWPERHLLPVRRVAMADADCALAGLKVVHEIALAAERSRQNAGPEQDLGDGIMEGLLLACRALGMQAADRSRPE